MRLHTPIRGVCPALPGQPTAAPPSGEARLRSLCRYARFIRMGAHPIVCHRLQKRTILLKFVMMRVRVFRVNHIEFSHEIIVILTEFHDGDHRGQMLAQTWMPQ